MKKPKLPRTDSIRGLAKFWDAHDLTDFEDELQGVRGPVFVRTRGATAIKVPLQAREAQTLGRMAAAKGVSPQQLLRTWVLQNLARRNNNQRFRRSA